jgi:ribosomal protein S18 acetylase RimI-like enzyme
LEFSIEISPCISKNAANYNQAMELNAVSNADVVAPARSGLQAETAVQDAALRFVQVGAEAWDYCRALAQSNMLPYLVKRGQHWASAAWDDKASSREFFELYGERVRIGFVSLWKNNDSSSIHIGDLQIEAQARNCGYGARALERVFAIARARGLTEVTLNVFRDNPAQNLYKRLGFVVVDRGFDKLKMRRTLCVQDDARVASKDAAASS